MARNLNWEGAVIEMLAYLAIKTPRSGGPAYEVGNFSKMTKKLAPTVLIVDDEPLIRWSLTETLGDHGYAVSEAENARMALEAIAVAERPFDVVLLDFRLPDSSDLRLLERVRSLTPGSRVIMITAHNSPEVALGATALGAYRVVSKPFEVATVAALVDEAHAADPKGALR